MRTTELECYTCKHVWEAAVIGGYKASPWDRFAEPDDYEPSDCPRCDDPESFKDEEEIEEEED